MFPGFKWIQISKTGRLDIWSKMSQFIFGSYRIFRKCAQLYWTSLRMCICSFFLNWCLFKEIIIKTTTIKTVNNILTVHPLEMVLQFITNTILEFIDCLQEAKNSWRGNLKHVSIILSASVSQNDLSRKYWAPKTPHHGMDMNVCQWNWVTALYWWCDCWRWILA